MTKNDHKSMGILYP